MACLLSMPLFLLRLPQLSLLRLPPPPPPPHLLLLIALGIPTNQQSGPMTCWWKCRRCSRWWPSTPSRRRAPRSCPSRRGRWWTSSRPLPTTPRAGGRASTRGTSATSLGHMLKGFLLLLLLLIPLPLLLIQFLLLLNQVPPLPQFVPDLCPQRTCGQKSPSPTASPSTTLRETPPTTSSPSPPERPSSSTSASPRDGVAAAAEASSATSPPPTSRKTPSLPIPLLNQP